MWSVDAYRTSWDQSFYFTLQPYWIFMFEWKTQTVRDDERITKGKKNISVVLALDSLWPPCPDAPGSCWSFEPGRPCRGFHAGRCKPRLRTPLSSGLCPRRCGTPPKSPPDKLKRCHTILWMFTFDSFQKINHVIFHWQTNIYKGWGELGWLVLILASLRVGCLLWFSYSSVRLAHYPPQKQLRAALHVSAQHTVVHNVTVLQ